MALKAPGRPSSRWSKSCQRPRSSSSADLVRFCFWEGGGRERVGKEKREKGEGRDETEKKRKTKCACAPCARGPSPGISVLIAPRRRFRQCRDRRGMLGRALVCFWPSGPALVCFGKLPKIESPRFPEKKSATKRERGKTAGLLSLTSEPRRRRAPSRSRSTRARSPSQAADRTTPASRQRGSPGTSRAQWSFVGRGAALTPPTSTHQRRASAAAARCSAIFGEQFFQERSLSRLFALCWGFGIEGRGGWPSGRSRRACRSRLLRDERRKMGGSDSVEVALSLTFERKREREREEREREAVDETLFPFFPLRPLSNLPCRPPWASRYASCRSSGATTGSNACLHRGEKARARRREKLTITALFSSSTTSALKKPFKSLLPLQGLSKLLGDAAPTCRRENKFENYFGRQIAVDASMHIYQFLVNGFV